MLLIPKHYQVKWVPPYSGPDPAHQLELLALNEPICVSMSSDSYHYFNWGPNTYVPSPAHLPITPDNKALAHPIILITQPKSSSGLSRVAWHMSHLPMVVLIALLNFIWLNHIERVPLLALLYFFLNSSSVHNKRRIWSMKGEFSWVPPR